MSESAAPFEFTADDVRWMTLALEQADCAAAHGEVPVGAVLVRDGELLAVGANAPIARHDPSAHAEMLALRAAAHQVANYRLPDSTLYVTLEPCLMCAGAILHARIARVVYATSDPKTGVAGSVLNVFSSPQLNHQTRVESGLLQAQAAERLKAFFAERRHAEKAARRARLELAESNVPSPSLTTHQI